MNTVLTTAGGVTSSGIEVDCSISTWVVSSVVGAGVSSA